MRAALRAPGAACSGPSLILGRPSAAHTAPPRPAPPLRRPQAQDLAASDVRVTLFHPDKALRACVTSYRLEFLGPHDATLETVNVPTQLPTEMATTMPLPPRAQQIVRAAAAAGPPALAGGTGAAAGGPGLLRMRVAAMDEALKGPPRELPPYAVLQTGGGGLAACRHAVPGAPRELRPSASGVAPRGAEAGKWAEVGAPPCGGGHPTPRGSSRPLAPARSAPLRARAPPPCPAPRRATKPLPQANHNATPAAPPRARRRSYR